MQEWLKMKIDQVSPCYFKVSKPVFNYTVIVVLFLHAIAG